MQEHWEACSDAIRSKMPEAAHRTWIKPLILLDFNPDELVMQLGAPNQFKADIVRKQYLPVIEEALREMIDPSIRIDIVVAGQQPAPATGDSPTPAPGTTPGASGPAPASALPARQSGSAPGTEAAAASGGSAPRGESHPLSPAPQSSPASSTPLSASEAAVLAADNEAALEDEGDDTADGSAFAGLGAQAPDEKTRLNPGLTFATFVTGKANDLARAAALQVADRPGGSYNPLFIQGGVGLGKTHLMQAIGNTIHEREPRAQIRYVTAQQFFQDFVSAMRREEVNKFQNYYRSRDMLLIDDIQFLSGKDRSQEEFFYTFETLVANRRQIVITSDTYPADIKIDERLISRLSSGLIVGIEPPELEMRVAILLRKAEQVRVKLPDDVAYFIGKNIRRNVRELEGALQRVIHYASFRSTPITLELVKEALKDILSFNRGQISIEMIQKTVAEYYKIKLADMYSKRKPAKIAVPRQIAMYLAKELTQKSLPEIGDAFGGKDHTTVLYAVRKITELRAHDTELNRQIHVLDQTLREYV